MRLAQLVPQNLRILDACTGSACIPLLLKHELMLRALETQIAAFDVSETARLLARENIGDYKLRYGGEVALFSGDVFDENVLEGEKYDLVVSNPPYVRLLDYKAPLALNGVERSVRLFEPETALVGNLEFYEALVRNVVLPLQCKGFVFELGYQEQVDRTREIIQEAAHGWKVGQCVDSRGNVRCVVGWREEMDFLADMCEWET